MWHTHQSTHRLALRGTAGPAAAWPRPVPPLSRHRRCCRPPPQPPPAARPLPRRCCRCCRHPVEQHPKRGQKTCLQQAEGGMQRWRVSAAPCIAAWWGASAGSGEQGQGQGSSRRRGVPTLEQQAVPLKRVSCQAQLQHAARLLHGGPKAALLRVECPRFRRPKGNAPPAPAAEAAPAALASVKRAPGRGRWPASGSRGRSPPLLLSARRLSAGSSATSSVLRTRLQARVGRRERREGGVGELTFPRRSYPLGRQRPQCRPRQPACIPALHLPVAGRRSTHVAAAWMLGTPCSSAVSLASAS